VHVSQEVITQLQSKKRLATVYIVYSTKLNRYYVGSCLDISARLEQHQNKTFNDSFTSKTDDWSLFLVVHNLDYRQARSIESHIKKMKSKTYIENLVKYPEIIQKLKEKYEV